MVVMGAALHALGMEWSAKLDDMYKRANKSLVMKCRYVEKVKLADLWVTINVNSFNLAESLLLTEGERQGQGAYSASVPTSPPISRPKPYCWLFYSLDVVFMT